MAHYTPLKSARLALPNESSFESHHYILFKALLCPTFHAPYLTEELSLLTPGHFGRSAIPLQAFLDFVDISMALHYTENRHVDQWQ